MVAPDPHSLFNSGQLSRISLIDGWDMYSVTHDKKRWGMSQAGLYHQLPHLMVKFGSDLIEVTWKNLFIQRQTAGMTHMIFVVIYFFPP
jgi:hypothetical protein